MADINPIIDRANRAEELNELLRERVKILEESVALFEEKTELLEAENEALRTAKLTVYEVLIYKDSCFINKRRVINAIPSTRGFSVFIAEDKADGS